MKKSQINLTTAISFLVVIVPYLFFLMGDQSLVRAACREDGIVESLGALCLLAASVTFFLLFLKDRNGNDFWGITTKKNIFWILLAIVFFIGFGEEISWGQRIIGWETPEELLESNRQEETNLHNLEFIQGGWLSFGRLFSLFWMSWCVLVPLLHKYSKPVSSLIERINLPVVSLLLAGLFVLNYFMHFAISPENEMQGSINEMKESIISYLFMIVALYFFKRKNT